MNQPKKFVVESFPIMREKVIETLGHTPETDSHEDRVITTSLIVGMLKGIGAQAEILFDSNEMVFGFTIEGTRFYLPMYQKDMGA